MEAAESRPAAEQDRLVIDQAIDYLASLGAEFSANDVRELLPVVSGSLIGTRFLAAAKGGRITRTGSTLADHEAGHARRVSTWIQGDGSKPVANAKQVAYRRLTPAEEQTVRTAHWALEAKSGLSNTTAARKVIRDLLDVLGQITGVNSSGDALM